MMAHFWTHTTEHEWTIMPLDGDAAWTLTGQHDQPVCAGHVTNNSQSSVLLTSALLPGKDETWILLAPPQQAVRVNGERVLLGICVLRDKDEIRVPGGVSLFFSTEKLARVELFPGINGQRFFCPRCKQEIPLTSPAVRCPQCNVWHHQSEDLPCWSYSDHCALCDQSSALDADYRWTPEEF
jgi:hypothetical protein